MSFWIISFLVSIQMACFSVVSEKSRFLMFSRIFTLDPSCFFTLVDIFPLRKLPIKFSIMVIIGLQSLRTHSNSFADVNHANMWQVVKILPLYPSTQLPKESLFKNGDSILLALYPRLRPPTTFSFWMQLIILLDGLRPSHTKTQKLSRS